MVSGTGIDLLGAAVSGLAADVRTTAEGAMWADTVPSRLDALVRAWDIVSLEPFAHDGTGSWIGACTAGDGTDGILKLAFPHEEGRDEIDGLLLCGGDPTVRVLRHDHALDAMLIERCRPGTTLSMRPEAERDAVVGALLRRYRRVSFAGSRIRPLSSLVDVWEHAAREKTAPDCPGGTPSRARGIGALRDLLDSSGEPRALATDLHAGNVLAAKRRPWLVIDPKPYVGDPAFDVTQHLLNDPDRLGRDPRGTVERVCAAADVDAERAGRWLLGRLRVEPGWNADVAAAVSAAFD